MGKIINITNKLTNEPSFVQIGEKMYKVDASKNAIMEFMLINKRMESGELNDIEAIDETIKRLIGKDVYKEIEKDHPEYTFANWQTIFFACVSGAMNRDIEELEDSFRKTSSQQ